MVTQVKPEKWDKTYLTVNAKVNERDENGRYKIEYDQEAVKLLAKEMDKATLKFPNKTYRMKWLIENGIYKEDLIRGTVTLDIIEELYEQHAKYYEGEPATVSLNTFLNSYALRILESDLVKLKGDYELPEKRFEDKYILLETRADRDIAIALESLADRPLWVIKQRIKILARKNSHPSTPSYSNSAIAHAGQLTSCFILKVDDETKSIREVLGYTIELSKMGGGMGYDVSDVRGLGDPVKNLDNRSHGIVRLARDLEFQLEYFDQDGKRKGSGAVYCNVHHIDFPLLLDAKKENVDEKMRLSNLSIGAIFTNKFMQLAVSGEEHYYTFSPYSIYKEYGIKLSDVDMTKMYDELVANPKIRKKKVNIQEMISSLASAASESGYPYAYFQENVNLHHVFKGVKIYCSNLCTEILQRQDNGNGVQCTLESINLFRTFVDNSLEETVYVAMEHLNGALQRTDFRVAEPVHRAKNKYRAVGLGTANLQGLLAYLGIPYESTEAIDFVNSYYAYIRYEVLKASNKLVDVYGVFDEFENTTYADGTHFDKYIENDFSAQTDKVKGLYEKYGIKTPTKEDWKRLKALVMEKGLANAYQQAIAPTGTIGYDMGVTPSITPNTQLIEKRTNSKGTVFFPMPNLGEVSPFMYKDAYRVSDFRYLDLVATMQQHVDQGISTTLFITDEYTTADWWERIVYAWKLGLKTVYYTRPKITGVKKDGDGSEGGQEGNGFEECELCV